MESVRWSWQTDSRSFFYTGYLNGIQSKLLVHCQHNNDVGAASSQGRGWWAWLWSSFCHYFKASWRGRRRYPETRYDNEPSSSSESIQICEDDECIYPYELIPTRMEQVVQNQSI